MSSLWATDRRLLPQKSLYLIDCKAIDMGHPRGDLRHHTSHMKPAVRLMWKHQYAYRTHRRLVP
ncbi:hypothetical protein NQZ68_011402 [Dissostichus eleginoides]|nr:hypothetical protein NQZ68_011402 [Dissostichus eleginoides]